jgi:SAM-dependent methyltransferase
MPIRFLGRIGAERTKTEDQSFYFFHEHQKAYSFCKGFVEGKRVLEIGSGSGYGTNRLAKNAKSITAIDKNRASINESREKYSFSNINFMCCKVENYSSDEKFDVIISLQVIEHLKDPEILLKKIHRSSEKNGLFIVSTPNRLTQSYKENPYHYREYSPKELLKILSNHFREVDLYGLFGDTYVIQKEERRKRYIMSFLKKDMLKLRKFIPRKCRQFIFDVGAYITREKIDRKSNGATPITEKSFQIIKNKTEESIDIIAVCKNLKF